MIRIARIAVEGTSEAGPFGGSLSFDPGLFVLTANNHFGKSLAVTGIAWCLGLEPMFGVKENDTTCFPIAAYEALDMSDDERRIKILESRAVLDLVRDDGAELRITRPIVGDATEVAVEVRSKGQPLKTSRLMARYHGMKDESGGLQNFLFEWFSLPRFEVLNNRGNAGEVYLENIAPHFYIDQNEGWTSTQALQVYRYGLLDIAQVSVEYLLGADQALRARLNEQTSAARETRLKTKAADLSVQVEAVFVRNGWPLQWSAHGKVDDVVKRWSKQTLKQIAKKQFNFDLAQEQRGLSEKADATRKLLSQEGIDRKNAAASSDASQLAINLKVERHTLRDSLRAARSQRTEHEQLAVNLEHRMHASQDVLRLKQDGIGRMEVVECPTCSQRVDPKSFGLTMHSTKVVEAHIDALRRDRVLVLENIRGTTNEVTRLAARLAEVDEALRTAESALANVNAVAGSVREQLAKAAIDLAAIDREMAKNHDVANRLDALQQLVDAWLAEAQQPESLDQSRGDLDERIAAFNRALRTNLLALGHSGVRRDEAHLVHIDKQDYVPYLDSRRVRALGSASDHARLIAAYALSLAAASHEVLGHHPGFVVFDEPLQQNPDPDHRELFLQFLEKSAKDPPPFQLLIFTSLEGDELARLREAGVRVEAKVGHLLNRIGPAS